jgi:hypothetical protein
VERGQAIPSKSALPLQVIWPLSTLNDYDCLMPARFNIWKQLSSKTAALVEDGRKCPPGIQPCIYKADEQ